MEGAAFDDVDAGLCVEAAGVFDVFGRDKSAVIVTDEGVVGATLCY